MKVYLFNTQHGLYEGETFENAEMLQNEEGITPVPPPDYEHGQIPVFDQHRKNWAVIPISVARQLLGSNPSVSTENHDYPQSGWLEESP